MSKGPESIIDKTQKAIHIAIITPTYQISKAIPPDKEFSSHFSVILSIRVDFTGSGSGRLPVL